MIGLKNLLKRVKFQTFQLKIFLKRINLQKVSKIQQELKHKIFGWLLFLAITKQLDVKRISTYLLVPGPPCYCHPDGSLRNSPKSKVFQYVKGLLQSDSPPNVKTVIADEMFLIRSIRRCRTYRLFVQTVLKTVLLVSMSTNHHYLKIVKDRKGVMTNPNVSFSLDHNKICQVISTNYWNYPALRNSCLDFSWGNWSSRVCSNNRWKGFILHNK